MPWLRNLFPWLARKFEPTKGKDQSRPLDSDVVRAATWSDVETVAALLDKQGAEYVLVGGYALVGNGLIRATGDIDILVRNSPQNNRRWIAALRDLPDGAAGALVGEDDPFSRDDDNDGNDEPGTIRVIDLFIVDVMPKTCGLTYEELEPHILRIESGGKRLNILDLPGLLKTKQGVRDKDRSDRQQIEIALARIGRSTRT